MSEIALQDTSPASGQGSIPKAYEPQAVEEKWYQFWLDQKCFVADPARVSAKRPAYSIVIPPPNVTGALHLGHALTNSIQDVLIRWCALLARPWLSSWETVHSLGAAACLAGIECADIRSCGCLASITPVLRRRYVAACCAHPCRLASDPCASRSCRSVSRRSFGPSNTRHATTLAARRLSTWSGSGRTSTSCCCCCCCKPVAPAPHVTLLRSYFT